jgi:LemA protein
MMESAAIILAIIFAVILIGILLLVRSARGLKRANIELNKDWLNIETLLKQRNDELPRLIQTCRSYMPADHDSFRLIPEARSACQGAASVEEKARADARLTRALQKLFSEAESYPDLKSNNTFAQLQNRLLEIEERIAERRELFNEDVRLFNARLHRPPGKWVRGMARVQPRHFFTKPSTYDLETEQEAKTLTEAERSRTRS